MTKQNNNSNDNIITTTTLDLKSSDFEQQCLRNILARTTLLASMSEDTKELTQLSSLAMALSSCSKDIERMSNNLYYNPYADMHEYEDFNDSDDCDGDCEHCLKCEDCEDNSCDCDE